MAVNPCTREHEDVLRDRIPYRYVVVMHCKGFNNNRDYEYSCTAENRRHAVNKAEKAFRNSKGIPDEEEVFVVAVCRSIVDVRSCDSGRVRRHRP